MYKHNDKTNGEFYLPETGKWFTFSDNTNDWGIKHGFPHEVDVLDGKRCALVKKTVVYIVIDEDAEGKPVTEKWSISKYSLWKKAQTV